MTEGSYRGTTTPAEGAPPITRRRIRLTGRVPEGARGRIMMARVALALILLVIIGQLVRVQLVLGEEYEARGVGMRETRVELPARRGRLYDRTGGVLATDIDTVTVYADPYAYQPQARDDGTVVERDPADARAVAERLAPLIGRDPDWIRERLTMPGTRFVYLARQLDWALRDQLLELQDQQLIDGVHLLTEPVRSYPSGPLAGQVLGFTGLDNDGLYGLEQLYDDVLVGAPGHVTFERAPGGLTIASGERSVTPALPGADLVLTLDRAIQHMAEQAAARTVEEYDAAGASVVVLEVGTGDVLAMANLPALDPRDPGATPQDLWRNRAVTDVFEPGSVQKTITAAAALEEGVVSPATVFSVPDAFKVGSKTFTDAHHHPTEDLTFEQIIARSSNVGTIQVAQLLGEEPLHRWLRAFGYGQPTGIGFPGESGGLLHPLEAWWNTSLPTIAIGHGVAVTLLQSAQVYATVANEGVAVTPRLVRGQVGADGGLDHGPDADRHRIVSDETASALQRMLATVVTGDEGTGSRARIDGYTAAGKTGTARKPSPQGGYADGYIASFVGFAPAEDPRIVVAVIIDEPGTAIYGGTVAAPVFSEVAGFALRHLRVPPTEGVTSLPDALKAAADRRAALETTGPPTPSQAQN